MSKINLQSKRYVADLDKERVYPKRLDMERMTTAKAFSK
jgi:hypothetical protein